jgi:SapC
MQAQVTLEGGRRLSLGGFMAINKEKLKALPGDKLAEMAKTDELELIYLHIQSMRNFEHLRDRLAIVDTPLPATSQPAGLELAFEELAVTETDGVASVH